MLGRAERPVPQSRPLAELFREKLIDVRGDIGGIAHEHLFSRRGSVCNRFQAPLAILFTLDGSPRKVPIGLIDRAKQPTEIRRLLNRPQSIERRAKKPNVILGKQPDGYDALGHHTNSEILRLNARKLLSCLAFRA
jgi:hypothetical protein